MAGRRILVEILGDDSSFRKATDSATKSGSKFGNVLQGVGQGIGQAVTMGVSMAASAVVDFAGKSVTAASDVAEAQSKVNVVFGQSAQSVTTFAETAAEKIGMSKLEALSATGTFGNLFKTMGMGEADAAKMSTSVTTLAADLGSFNNLPTADVLEKIRSGLVGESEPLRSLGINLTEAAVAQKAVNMGLATSTKTVTEAAKVQARYALIVEQSTDAQGDYARTSDGLANTTKTLQAKMDNLSASIGEKLLPVVLGLATALDKLLSPATEDTKILKDLWVTVSDPVFGTRTIQINSFNKALYEGTAAYKKATDAAADDVRETKSLAAAEERARSKTLSLGSATVTAAKQMVSPNGIVSALDDVIAGLEGIWTWGGRVITRLLAIWAQVVKIFAHGPTWLPSVVDQHGSTFGTGSGKASGGWVGLGGPETVLVGESGPEYVVPNNQLSRGGNGRSGDVHIHVGYFIGSGHDLDRFANLIAGRLRLAGAA